MIDLNPLVIERGRTKAPSFASAEEYHALWYAITDRISYLPGGLAQGKVTYHGCFNDLPDGLQTHVYAPMGLEIRSRWLLGGNLPGEPAVPVELGLGIPRQGLYLREDVDMKCNLLMVSFVKKNLKNSHSTLVDRMLEKAKLTEVGKSNASLANNAAYDSYRQSMASGTPSLHNSSPALTHSSLASEPQAPNRQPSPLSHGGGGAHHDYNPRNQHQVHEAPAEEPLRYSQQSYGQHPQASHQGQQLPQHYGSYGVAPPGASGPPVPKKDGPAAELPA